MYDYIVVGAGVGGAIATERISELTSNFLVLEEGKWAEKEDFTHSQSLLNLYRNSGINPVFGPHIFSYAEGKGVGGGSIVNGGLFWRTPKHIIEKWKNEYPENENIQMFEQYFSELEERMSVGGSQSESPFEEYDQDSKYLEKRAKKLGLKVVKARRALVGCKRNNNCPSGCLSGAKQSLDKVYFKKNEKNIIDCAKVISIKKRKDIFYIKAFKNGLSLIFKSRKVVLSMGAVNSAYFLLKNKLIDKRSLNFQFHANIKSIVVFKNKVKSHLGTMFTEQLQEYEENDIYIMPSNFNSIYLETVIASFDETIKSYLSDKEEFLSIYTTQVRPMSQGKIRSIFNQKVVTHKFHKADYDKMKESLIILCKVLFSDEIESIIIPYEKGLILNSKNYNSLISELNPKKLELLSVHLMASIPLNPKKYDGLLNRRGELYDCDNLFVLDASILPTNIGESPQGTIMALGKSVVNHWQN